MQHLLLKVERPGSTQWLLITEQTLIKLVIQSISSEQKTIHAHEDRCDVETVDKGPAARAVHVREDVEDLEATRVGLGRQIGERKR
jgi:hypothetical protein